MVFISLYVRSIVRSLEPPSSYRPTSKQTLLVPDPMPQAAFHRRIDSPPRMCVQPMYVYWHKSSHTLILGKTFFTHPLPLCLILPSTAMNPSHPPIIVASSSPPTLLGPSQPVEQFSAKQPYLLLANLTVLVGQFKLLSQVKEVE